MICFYYENPRVKYPINSTQVLTDVLAATCEPELVGVVEVSDEVESCLTRGLCDGWWVAVK